MIKIFSALILGKYVLNKFLLNLARILRIPSILLVVGIGAAGCAGTGETNGADLIADAFLIQNAEEMTFEMPQDQNPRLMLKGVSPTMDSDELARRMDVDEWLSVFPFEGEDPAKGVLVIGGNATRIALYNPMYDPEAGTLSYEIQVLAGADLPAEATMVQMRLQDCPSRDFFCVPNCFKSCGSVDHVGTCWSWFPLGCLPCDCSKLIDECNSGDRAHCCEKDDGCLPAGGVSMSCPYERTC